MELRLEHLVKDFSGTKAVNDVSITIQDGKLTGLLGPSGCGKSTTLYLISGLESPTSGRIFFGDRDVTALPPEKRGIGLVFQTGADRGSPQAQAGPALRRPAAAGGHCTGAGQAA